MVHVQVPHLLLTDCLVRGQPVCLLLEPLNLPLHLTAVLDKGAQPEFIPQKGHAPKLPNQDEHLINSKGADHLHVPRALLLSLHPLAAVRALLQHGTSKDAGDCMAGLGPRGEAEEDMREGLIDPEEKITDPFIICYNQDQCSRL